MFVETNCCEKFQVDEDSIWMTKRAPNYGAFCVAMYWSHVVNDVHNMKKMYPTAKPSKKKTEKTGSSQAKIFIERFFGDRLVDGTIETVGTLKPSNAFSPFALILFSFRPCRSRKTYSSTLPWVLHCGPSESFDLLRI